MFGIENDNEEAWEIALHNSLSQTINKMRWDQYVIRENVRRTGVAMLPAFLVDGCKFEITPEVKSQKHTPPLRRLEDITSESALQIRQSALLGGAVSSIGLAGGALYLAKTKLIFFAFAPWMIALSYISYTKYEEGSMELKYLRKRSSLRKRLK